MFGQQLVLQRHEARRRVFATCVAAIAVGIKFGAVLKDLLILVQFGRAVVSAPELLIAFLVLHGMDDIVVPHDADLAAAFLQLILAKVGALVHKPAGTALRPLAAEEIRCGV